jgi:hypothetical protein
MTRYSFTSKLTGTYHCQLPNARATPASGRFHKWDEDFIIDSLIFQIRKKAQIESCGGEPGDDLPNGEEFDTYMMA